MARAFWRAVVVAVAGVVFCVAPTAAKRVHGTVALRPGQSKVVTKFCFDFAPPPCKKPPCNDRSKYPGMMNFTSFGGRRTDGGADDERGAEVYIAHLDDEYFSFPEVSQVWGEAKCTDILRASKNSFRLNWKNVATQTENHTVPLTEKVRPRWWYIAFVSCSNFTVELSYDMHLVNQLRGWQSEFSMDAMGVLAVTLCLCVAFGGLVVVQCRSLHEWQATSLPGRWSRLHPALVLLSAAAALAVLGHAWWLAYYLRFMSRGEAVDHWAALGRASIIAAKSLMTTLVLLLAHGHCVCMPDIEWSRHRELLGGVALFGCLGFGLETWGDSEFRSMTTEYIYDTRPGLMLVAFDVFWLWLYVSRAWGTFQNETRVKPRRFYRSYAPFLALWFGQLPFIAAVGGLIAAWDRFIVTYAVNGTVHALTLAVLIHTFRPHVAVQLYDLKAAEYEPVNTEELGSLALGHSSKLATFYSDY